MKIRTKTAIIFLALSLLPLTTIGVIAYQNGKEAIRRNLGLSFQQMADETIDKIDRSLYAVYRDVKTWSELEVMQEAVTGDVDGKISTFLIGIAAEYGSFGDISVISPDGIVIASSHPQRIGLHLTQTEFYKNALRGKASAEDVHFDESSREWTVHFSFPIKSKYEKDKVIGVLSGMWKADALSKMARAGQGETAMRTHILLIRSDGLVIAAPESEKGDLFQRNLIKEGSASASRASQKESGYLVEVDSRQNESLVGYGYSRGYRDFAGLGWSVLVLKDAESAFEPIDRLKRITFGVGAIVALSVGAISLMVTQKMTNPILEISRIASRIARGDFEGKINHAAKDEIGSLADSFNQMIEDLKAQRAQLVDKDYVDSIIANMINSLIVVDAGNLIKRVNKATLDLLGYTEEELMGQPGGIIFSGGLLGSGPEDLVHKGFISNFETFYRAKDGQKIPVFFSGSVMRNQHGKVQGIVCVAQDISERKKSIERLNYLASHDTLTALPNRGLFNDRLRQSLARASRRNHIVAVLFLDLDRFKLINDTLGHDLGDLLLKAASERLTHLVRQSDTVARVGGDEFTVIVDEISRTEEAARLSQKILDGLAPPFLINGHELFITASIGISLFPNDGVDCDTLLKNAETAMYRAKEQGKSNYQHYAPDMNAKATERLTLETRLRRALERKELLLHYQPQVSLKTGRIIGMEALIRWNHPELGLVSPAKFIPLAEESGLIVPIGEWVLRAAAAQNKAWQQAGLPPIRVGVNMSARQFHEKNLSETVNGALREADLDPRYLEIELTESVIMKNADVTIAALSEFHTMGIEIAIDDFGSGYSSLNYLKRFPVNKLKVDQSFVRDIITDPDDAAISAAIISMGHSLQLKVIAEGVETAEQLKFLRSIQCDEIQGYLFSRPLPAAEATKLLAEGKHL